MTSKVKQVYQIVDSRYPNSIIKLYRRKRDVNLFLEIKDCDYVKRNYVIRTYNLELDKEQTRKEWEEIGK